MEENKLFDFPREVPNSVIGRVYEIGEGIFVPSVTTFIFWGSPVPKPILDYMMKKSGGDPDKYWNMRTKEQAIGTQVHASIEQLWRNLLEGSNETIDFGREVDQEYWNDEVQKAMTCNQCFMYKHNPKPIAIEESLFHKDFPWCGRFDLVAELDDGEIWLLDYKTSKHVGVDPRIQIQLSAYAMLWNASMPEELHVTRIGAIHLKKNFVPKKDGLPSANTKFLFPFKIDEEAVWDTYRQFSRYYSYLDKNGAPKIKPNLVSSFGFSQFYKNQKRKDWDLTINMAEIRNPNKEIKDA